jgi:dienelactone hydrolase
MHIPVVMLVHGSGGMGANIELWTNELGDLGISTFAIDGFTGRGLTQVSTDQAQLTGTRHARGGLRLS